MNAATICNSKAWTIVSDDSCPVVRFLTSAVRRLDTKHFFRFVGKDSQEKESLALLQILKESHWSLLLLDDEDEKFLGPDAIPFILKNLPYGRIFAVAYTIPGTMWLTNRLYMLISSNRRKIVQKTQIGQAAEASQ